MTAAADAWLNRPPRPAAVQAAAELALAELFRSSGERIRLAAALPNAPVVEAAGRADVTLSVVAPVADGATATSRGERVSARACSLRTLAA